MENKIHKTFKLQGKSFSKVGDLIDFSATISIEIHSFLMEWFNNNNFIKVKTSGSTGVPKTIQLQKEHMINSAKATGDFFELYDCTSALLCMSVNFIAGKMMLVRALTLGWHLDVVDPTASPLKNTEKEYDFSAMVPLQVNSSLADLQKVKKIIIGGGVVSMELWTKIQDIKTEIFATYGMTETVTHIAIKKLNNFDFCLDAKIKIPSQAENGVNFRHAELVSASHYKTLPNIKISTDNRGCLVINAPKIANEIIATNDLVELISESEFKWLGRFDNIINSGGIKLIPEKIEEKLSEIINNRFFVAGMFDPILGEKLVLVVEGNKNNLVLNEVSNLKSLTKFEKPREIYYLPKFMDTPTQKINRIETLKMIKSID